MLRWGRIRSTTTGRAVASALVEEIGAVAAACVLEAEHGCVSLRGVRRARARVVTECFLGDETDITRLRGAFQTAF